MRNQSRQDWAFRSHSDLGLILEEGLELLGEHDVALELELPGHEGLLRVQLSGHEAHHVRVLQRQRNAC